MEPKEDGKHRGLEAFYELLHITVGRQSLQVTSKHSVPHFQPQLQFHKYLRENGAIMLPFLQPQET